VSAASGGTTGLAAVLVTVISGGDACRSGLDLVSTADLDRPHRDQRVRDQLQAAGIACGEDAWRPRPAQPRYSRDA
jgi:hypothetical protein